MERYIVMMIIIDDMGRIAYHKEATRPGQYYSKYCSTISMLEKTAIDLWKGASNQPETKSRFSFGNLHV